MKIQYMKVRYLQEVLRRHCHKVRHTGGIWKLFGEEREFRLSSAGANLTAEMLGACETRLTDREKAKFTALEEDLKEHGLARGGLTVEVWLR